MAELTRADFDACLDFLAGDLRRAAGRLRARARRGARAGRRRGSGSGRAGSASASRRVIRWFWSNVGTITLGRDRCRCSPTAWRSARSREPMPSGWSPATGSCSTAGASSSAAARARSIHARAGGGEPGPADLAQRSPVALDRAGPRGGRVPGRGGRGGWPGEARSRLRAWLIEAHGPRAQGRRGPGRADRGAGTPRARCRA